MKRSFTIIILFIFGCIVLFGKFQEQDHRFLSLEQFGSEKELVPTRSGELIKGDIIKGTFVSKYDGIGQLAVRFNNNYHDSEDILTFRIKERGTDDWFYQAQYKTDQFLPHRLFPFGFPTISNSKGKVFDFELESLRGIQSRGISLDSQNPTFTVKAIYTKNNLLENKNALLYFIFHKLLNLIIYIPLFIYSFSPLLFFLVLNFIPFIKSIIYVTFITTITIGSSIYAPNVADTTILIVLFMYILVSNRYQYDSRVSLLISAILIFIATIFLAFGLSVQANSFAVWGYVFLWITAIQQIREELFHYHPKTTLEKFLSQD